MAGGKEMQHHIQINLKLSKKMAQSQYNIIQWKTRKNKKKLKPDFQFGDMHKITWKLSFEGKLRRTKSIARNCFKKI